MGYKKDTFRSCTIVEEILSRPLTGCETGVETRNKVWVRERFGEPHRNATQGVQVRIASNLHFRLPAGPDCLPRALVMPTVNQYRVVLPAANDAFNLRGIEPGKPAMPGLVRNILQEGMRVSIKQWH